MKNRPFGASKRAAAIVVLALLAGAAVLARTSNAVPEPQDWDTIEVKAVPVTGGVHMIAGLGGNIGVLPGDSGVLLIDTEFPQLHDKIVAALLPLAGGGRVRFVLNTNWHFDHALGNELFRKDGAVIVGHVNCVARMGREQFYDVLNERHGPYPPAGWPEITFTDSMATGGEACQAAPQEVSDVGGEPEGGGRTDEGVLGEEAHSVRIRASKVSQRREEGR